MKVLTKRLRVEICILRLKIRLHSFPQQALQINPDEPVVLEDLPVIALRAEPLILILHNQLPDDVFFLIAMTRWAIARAYRAVTDANRNDPLGKILEDMAVRIFEATSKLGPLDTEAEEKFILQLDRALGFSDVEAKTLVDSCKQFAHQLLDRSN